MKEKIKKQIPGKMLCCLIAVFAPLIAQAQGSVTVQWTNTSLTYNGTPQAPTATATDGGVNVPVTVTGAQTNTGSGYIATAMTSSGYTLLNATTPFSIAPATVAVQWTNTSLTCNGTPQAPTATATGVLGENLPLTVTGAQINAGAGYTATASLSPPDINYTLSDAETMFIINAATGIDEITAAQVKIYPNPASGVLYFSTGTPFEITDMQGKVLLKSEKAVKSVNISGLPSGTYLVTLTAGTGKAVTKIIKE